MPVAQPGNHRLPPDRLPPDRLPPDRRLPNRRTVLAGAGAAVGGVAGSSLLAACGGSASGPASGSGTGAPRPVATVSSIPDGGTISVENPDGGTLLLTRNGTAVTGLNAKCTHQGCTVAPKEGVLKCPCHGSKFQPGTGAVITGPADAPLAAVNVTVTGNDVMLAP
jgi:cytochrome b6-f complex iron-sulfur subunit